MKIPVRRQNNFLPFADDCENCFTAEAIRDGPSAIEDTEKPENSEVSSHPHHTYRHFSIGF